MIDPRKKYKTENGCNVNYIGKSDYNERFPYVFEIYEGDDLRLSFYDGNGNSRIANELKLIECKPFDGWEEDDRLVLRRDNSEFNAHYSINGCVWADGKTSHTSSTFESLIGCYDGWIVSNLDKGESVQL